MRSIFYLLSRLANSFVFASNRTKDYYRNLAPLKKNFLIQSPVDVNIYDPDFEYPIEEFIKSFMKEKNNNRNSCKCESSKRIIVFT